MTPVRDSRKRGRTGLDPRKAGIGPRSFIIDGHVYSGGNPLAGATVELRLSADSSLVSQATSDGLGAFSFTVIGNTTQHYLTAAKFGYASAESAHTIVGGMTVDLTLTQEQVVAQEISYSAQPMLRGGRKRPVSNDDEELMLIVHAFIKTIGSRRWAA